MNGVRGAWRRLGAAMAGAALVLFVALAWDGYGQGGLAVAFDALWSLCGR